MNIMTPEDLGLRRVKPRHQRRHLTIDRALTDQEHQLRDAARAYVNGDKTFYPEPADPNEIEIQYLKAIRLLSRGKTVLGIDALEAADRSALLRLGRRERASHPDFQVRKQARK